MKGADEDTMQAFKNKLVEIQELKEFLGTLSGKWDDASKQKLLRELEKVGKVAEALAAWPVQIPWLQV